MSTLIYITYSSSLPPPQTPSHPSLLPALSPSATEQTPAPLHTLPMHLQQQGQQPQSSSRPGSAHQQPSQNQGTPTPSHVQLHQPHQPMHPHPVQAYTQGQHQIQQPPMHEQQMQNQGQGMMRPPSSGAHGQHGSNGGIMQPQQQQQQQQQLPHQGVNVFGVVMGQPGHGIGPGGMAPAPAKVYASVYSGIPVFEAMIRGISVMRRTSDSWVNATQILKVAGIPKSARTKILEKEILTGMHEKVQGGYGKYQGTWIPFQRGQELAEQYGVTAYLAPIFDFKPSPSNLSALPMATGETPDRAQKTPAPHMPYHPGAMQGRVDSPFQGGQYTNGEVVMGIPPHPSALAYPTNIYYQTPGAAYPVDRRIGVEMTPTRSAGGSLDPPADIANMGLPPANSSVYIDQYGQPHPTFHLQTIPEMPPPAKRQRSDPNDVKPDGPVEDNDDESVDEVNEAALPASMKLSTKPLRPKPNAVSARTRSKLLALFSADEPVNIRSVLGVTDETASEVDIDVVIDNQGHTALHWACALARLNIVAQLIELGADIHRGNYAGETPLIRSVLTTNHAESGSFHQLLTYLSASVRTLDHAHRTVIHHVALIAGVKGRASSARSYMAQVLDWVAKEATSPSANGSVVGLKNLVDVQDVHGDTALNVAARVGNKALVNLLLDAGADKARANKLGLKPLDFGIEQEALWIPPAETIIANLKSEVPKPERQSRDVQKNISAIFETINDTFAAEMTAKQTALNNTEQSVRLGTKALADKRLQVVNAQAALEELERMRQKSDNLRKALTLPVMQNSQDWTGRETLSTEREPPMAFAPLPQGVPQPVASGSSDPIPLPMHGEADAVMRLKRLNLWEDRMCEVLEDRIKSLEGETADKAVKYRKLVSLCTKVPVEKVDGSLDVLITAIESDGQSIDLSRIAGFMNRLQGQSGGL
ncbi:hypothetical protein BD324DRAFT_639565 [Kockovaella imperatae]|uniref:HTH APSES-type domain-containing protein n=1 Tax=Kockovaella imperatae TaxID=4999 RepID=A0A1Y1U633_9TREE|nr:hypothetical protein BD324DRAFT_639565 [Kockovaella imperatae]ORX33493.1 hypothetical protein BD324DRAFT_639565 [Kockovaella imperatae]